MGHTYEVCERLVSYYTNRMCHRGFGCNRKPPKTMVEMKVWVRCARGVQVAYFTLHHRGCTLVLPSTWAKRVRREDRPNVEGFG